MLTRDELIHFLRRHRNERLLSVYLNAEEGDPAKRRVWRRVFDQIVAEARANQVDGPGEADAFDRAVKHLERELEQFVSFLPEHGWVGFASARGLVHAETLPVVMPNRARWAGGPSVAPYVRALRLATPVLMVLVDRQRARLYRSRLGVFDELTAIETDRDYGDLSDNVNMSKRATTHTGVRGEADADVAKRLEDVGAERLLKKLVETVRQEVGTDGTAVVGGPPEMTAATMQRLAKFMEERVIEDPTVDGRTSPSELARTAAVRGAAIVESLQLRRVDQIVDLARSGGRGSLGRPATTKGLEERRVEALLVTRAAIESDPEQAERWVRAAFDQDAQVEEIVGPGAERLNREADGVAARLRYIQPVTPTSR
jgi:hypothetical protein